MAWSNGSCTLKFRKYDKVYRNSTGTCTASIENKKDLEARSYSHWLFLTTIKGLVVFNDYNYSTSTSGHQSAVRSLIKGKFKVDIIVDQRESLSKGVCLENYYTSILLCEVKLSKKGLSKKSRETLEKQKTIAENYIASLLKFKVCKKFKKEVLAEMKKSIGAKENNRIERNRAENKKIAEKKKSLDTEMNDLSPISLEKIETEMNDTQSINF